MTGITGSPGAMSFRCGARHIAFSKAHFVAQSDRLHEAYGVAHLTKFDSCNTRHLCPSCSDLSQKTRVVRVMASMCCNRLSYQGEPCEAFFQVMVGIQLQISNSPHRFVVLCLAEALFDEDFSRKRVEVEESFWMGQLRPSTGIDITTDWPLIAFHVIAVMASEDPI